MSFLKKLNPFSTRNTDVPSWSTQHIPPLKFHNTLSGQLETFEALNGNVKMYNCGPTVYDRQHIGNLRPYVFADILRRTLTAWGHSVTQVINITDVGHLVSDADEGEDKMEKSAKAQGRSAQEIAKEITQGWFEDLDLLGIDRSKIQFPRATEYIGEQIALVQSLEQKGYAYTIKDGVYFDTSRFSGYGKLGGINIAGQQAGGRVEKNEEKKSPHDFALWKLSKKKEKRQQEWDSPWGTGFPGWHIECTAMIFKLLGRQIDIHTGGIDHIPVHHNNEIAQAEASTGKQYVRYWMHNEFITIEGKKISKSLGNTIYLSQLIDRGLSARALRYLYLTTHYRSLTNFTWDAAEAAHTALHRLKRSFFELDLIPGTSANKDFIESVQAALANDLDTPKVIALMWDLLKNPDVPSAVKRASLLIVDKVLGLGLTEEAKRKDITVQAGSVSMTLSTGGPVSVEVTKLMEEREAAREAKDFKKADALREAIEMHGYALEDTPQGPKLTEK